MDKEALLDVLHQFSIPRKDYKIQPINQGFINDTFLVVADEMPLYILQRINTVVFPNVKEIMGNIRRALGSLNSADYTKIVLVPSNSGNAFLKDTSGKYWRLMTYISHSTAYDTTEDKEVAFEAGRIISTFHHLLLDAPIDSFEDIIPGFHDLSLREIQFKEAMGSASSELKTTARHAIAFAHETIPRLQSWEKTELPVRICHNDTKLNNILFSESTGKALCLIDLDTLMRGYFHYDFGDAVRTIVNTASEDEIDHSKITFDKGLFRAFIGGISSNGSFLSDHELAVLPLGAALMPFLHGIRALTDYLNGNRYYKVAYENQNLDRCLSLFDFTRKALSEVSFMEQVIEEVFDR